MSSDPTTQGSIPDYAARFWLKVEKTDTCWLWTDKHNRGGYGWVYAGKSFHTNLAHRISYILTNGPIPKNLHVLHHCDNPPCVNPAHLFLGTQADNNRDMYAKGRAARISARGERSPRARLTSTQVLAIFNDHTSRTCDLAREYGVSWTCIGHIRDGRSWSWITQGHANTHP